MGNLKLRPSHIDRAITKSLRQGQGLRFSRKDQKFEVNKLFLLYGFLFCFCRPVIISLWVLLENNALELANQSACYIGCKHKPYNKIIQNKIVEFILLVCRDLV